MTGQRIQQEAICYQWFKQRLSLSVSEPSISQRSQIKEDTVEPSVPAREFNLKVYAAKTWHNDSASLGHEPDSPITVARQRVPRRYQLRHRGRLIQGALGDENIFDVLYGSICYGPYTLLWNNSF